MLFNTLTRICKCVPVKTGFTILRLASALAVYVVEILFVRANSGFLNADALTNFIVPDLNEVSFWGGNALLWSAAATAAVTVPVEFTRAGAWRAYAIATIFIPMEIFRAEVRFALAATIFGVVDIAVPVLVGWADLRLANTGTLLVVPVVTFVFAGIFSHTDASAKFVIEFEASFAAT